MVVSNILFNIFCFFCFINLNSMCNEFSITIVIFRDNPAKKAAVLKLNMNGRFAVNVVVRYR